VSGEDANLNSIDVIRKEITMLRKIASLAVAVFLLPATVHAYGAAHVGYTHVGPNGVYHTGETVAHGPGGTYAHGSTGAYGAGGNAYHSESSAGAYHGPAGGGAYGEHSSTEYHYSPSYSGSTYGGAAYHSSSYGYVR
jgi:hypothetical protein